MIGNTKVDIVIMAYNAEKYIREAIESVLLQKTDFKFHIHVYDDCSTDRTASFVSGYKSENITLHIARNNLGTFGNLQKAIANCKASFVALLEGDDYWNDKNKLNEQIDFLETNPNYVGCASNSLIFNQGTSSFAGLYNPAPKKEYSLEELFSIPPFQIGTLVYRREFLSNISNEFKNTISNDKVVYTLLAKYGNIFFFNKPLAVYRKHSISISNSEKSGIIYVKHKLLYSIMKKQFEQKYYPYINEALYTHLKGYMLILVGQRKSIRFIFWEYFFTWIKLKKWLSLTGYKHLYYFISNFFK